MNQKQQAVGSIWNVNSWHWEMKNYTEATKKILEEKLLKLSFDAPEGIKITHTKVRFPKAQAEINVRKGKQILVYEFELEVDTLAENDQEESKGSYRIREVMNDDLNDIIIDDIKATEKNKCGSEMKKWVKKNAKEQIIGVFKEMENDLKQQESDPKKIEEDKRKREEAQLATQKARDEKGAEKERLLEEQREKQRAAKEEAYRQHFSKKQ